MTSDRYNEERIPQPCCVAACGEAGLAVLRFGEQAVAVCREHLFALTRRETLMIVVPAKLTPGTRQLAPSGWGPKPEIHYRVLGRKTGTNGRRLNPRWELLAEFVREHGEPKDPRGWQRLREVWNQQPYVPEKWKFAPTGRFRPACLRALELSPA